MPHKESGPSAAETAPSDTLEITRSGRQAVCSARSVSWWSVHEHVQLLLAEVGSWPMAGTPAWCALRDDDPEKLAALMDAAQHWALRVETCQQARAKASCDISSAADWSGIARAIRQRTNSAYIRREVA